MSRVGEIAKRVLLEHYGEGDCRAYEEDGLRLLDEMARAMLQEAEKIHKRRGETCCEPWFDIVDFRALFAEQKEAP